MTSSWTPPDAEVVSLKEAAVRLGISPDATRKRLERGTLRGEKRGGRWRVFLEPDAQGEIDQDATVDAGRTPQDAAPDSALIARLESEVTFLRAELADRTEEIRRRDHIIAGLVERLRALPASISQDAPGDVIRAPRSDDQSAQALDTRQSAWRRWWRRVTGAGEGGDRG